jgi:hypothetical protein
MRLLSVEAGKARLVRADLAPHWSQTGYRAREIGFGAPPSADARGPLLTMRVSEAGFDWEYRENRGYMRATRQNPRESENPAATGCTAK